MNGIQLFFCLFGFAATSIFNAEARLKGEGIIGGDNATEGQFPYQISLQMYGFSICGGSIIDERHVVTAAHCVVQDGSLSTTPLKVVAGVIDLKADISKKISVDVAQVIIPKEFTKYGPFSRTTGDIAVLKLNEDLDLSSNSSIGKINLPKRSKTFAGVTAVISGFGYNKIEVGRDPKTGELIEKNGVAYLKMRYAEANVISRTECQTHFLDRIKPQHICAALVQRDPKIPEGICSGDSGGPLVYKDVLIGVVSSSPFGCREDYEPAVYTRVSEYLDFINRAVKGVIRDSMMSINLIDSEKKDTNDTIC